MQYEFDISVDAAPELASRLSALLLETTVIVALSPAAVGFAFDATQRLGCELDLLLAGRIRAPGNPAFTVGAVLDLDEPEISVDEKLVREAMLPPGYLHAQHEKLISEIRRQHAMYLGHEHGVLHDYTAKDVVIIDDGVEQAIIEQVLRHIAKARASSVRIVHVDPDAVEPVDDRKIADLLRQSRRLHGMLH